MQLFFRSIVLVVASLGFAAFGSCNTESETLVRNYQLLSDNVNRFLSTVDYSEDDYHNSYIEDYLASPIVDLSYPLPVKLEWEATTPVQSYRLSVSDNFSSSSSWVYEIDGAKHSIDVYNLIPNKKYFWIVTALNSGKETFVQSGTFKTSGQIRFIHIPGEHIGNFRDLGGLVCGNSGYIKYGKLIRGAEVLREDGGPYMRISDEGIAELRDKIGCTVELDFGDLWAESPLEGRGFEVYSDHDVYGFYAYDRLDRGLRSEVGRECLHNCLELIIDKLSEGKTVLFHCNAGADRTGTFAFIIESLCGVSDNDKSKDYELTSFSTNYDRQSNHTSYVIRKRNTSLDGCGYNTMVSYICQRFDGVTLNEKVYNMCITSVKDGGLGINQGQIESLRSCLLSQD